MRPLLHIQKISLAFILLAASSFVFSQANNWIQRNDIGSSIQNGPPYRFQHSTFSFSIGNKGYVGIISDTTNVTFVFEYDPTTNIWTEKAGLPGKVRGGSVVFSIGQKGYVGMGTTEDVVGGSNYVKDFWEFDPVQNTWTRKADFPFETADAIGFSIGDKGYMGLPQKWTGAYNYGYKVYAYTKELWQYDPLQDAWTRKTDYPGTVRFGMRGFAINNEAFMGLGQADAVVNGVYTPTFYNEFWAYNSLNDTWTRKADYPGTGRPGRISASANGKGYIGGGDKVASENTTSQFWEFDPAANTWTRKKDLFDSARNYPASFVISNKLFMGFGENAVFGTCNDIWQYDAVNDDWKEKRALKYEAARCSFQIADTGYVLVDHFNFQLNKHQLALLAFNTTTKEWDRKADFPSTDILWGMGSFSLGNKGYVVSGASSDLTIAYKNLYQYDPALNSWTQKADFPEEGRRNICTYSINGKGYAGLGWGAGQVNGIPQAHKTNDFWEYDPVLNSWTQKEDLISTNEVCFFNSSTKGYVINEQMETWEFNPFVNHWSRKNNFPGRPRGNALGMSTGNKGYVFGGQDNVPVFIINSYIYIHLSDLWVYDTDADSWNLNVSFPGYERSTRIGFSAGNKLYLGEGYNQTKQLHDWWEYTPAQALTQYVFNGTGNFSDFNNWINNNNPPFDLSSGSEIIINPPLSGECILDILQILSAGSKFIVAPRTKLSIKGSLTIQ